MDPLNLLDLNDDCLLYIFDFLTIKENFVMISTGNYRLTALATRSIGRIKHLNTDMRILEEYNPAQLEVIGCNLQSLKLKVGYSLRRECVLNTLRALCRGAQDGPLRKLTLRYVNFNEEFRECVDLVAPQLHYLDLSNCQMTTELLNPLLRRCKKLRHLHLVGNYLLTGTWLSSISIHRLRSLTVEMCERWNDDVGAWARLHPNICVILYEQHCFERTIFNEPTA